LAERFVTLQEPIQRTQFAKRFGRKRPAHMFANESSEPLAQSTSLVRHLVQFTRHRSRPQLIQRIRWSKPGVYLTFFGSFVFGTPGFPLSDVPLQQIAADAAAGRLDVKPARIFGFDEIREAHRAMEANQAGGKMGVERRGIF
jgi:Zinc-binding dehydrogenase